MWQDPWENSTLLEHLPWKGEATFTGVQEGVQEGWKVGRLEVLVNKTPVESNKEVMLKQEKPPVVSLELSPGNSAKDEPNHIPTFK